MLIKPEPVRKEIPHEPGEWMMFLRLSSRQIRKAKKVREHENLETMKILGAEFAKAMTADDGDDPVKARERRRRALENLKEFEWDISNFDVPTLLQLAIPKKKDAWSYPEPPGEDIAAQIDEQTAAWAGEEIIKLTRPKTKAAEKN